MAKNKCCPNCKLQNSSTSIECERCGCCLDCGVPEHPCHCDLEPSVSENSLNALSEQVKELEIENQELISILKKVRGAPWIVEGSETEINRISKLIDQALEGYEPGESFCITCGHPCLCDLKEETLGQKFQRAQDLTRELKNFSLELKALAPQGSYTRGLIDTYHDILTAAHGSILDIFQIYHLEEHGRMRDGKK